MVVALVVPGRSVLERNYCPRKLLSSVRGETSAAGHCFYKDTVAYKFDCNLTDFGHLSTTTTNYYNNNNNLNNEWKLKLRFQQIPTKFTLESFRNRD